MACDPINSSMIPCSMSDADSLSTVSNDYSRRAGFCVEVLGWLTLLRLDLLGLVLIKAGRGVRARDRRWWKVAVALWALHLAGLLVIAAVVVLIGGKVSLFGKTFAVTFKPWMIVVFISIGVALVVPFIWLISPATRRAMEVRTAKAPLISSD